ncbi:MAG: hypothetical protein ACRDHG_03825 [Anaerolineales bacterium]
MRPARAWSRIEAELSYARAAREHGKEGRARVSARRAAGWAVDAFLSRRGESPARGAFDLLGWLEREGPEDLRQPAARLRQQVTSDHRLPHDEDPLEDAELIVRTLLGPMNSDQ